LLEHLLRVRAHKQKRLKPNTTFSTFQTNLSHLASGDLLREQVKNGTELGLKAKEYMNAGKLVPNELVIDMISETVGKPECKRIMFDGFPRSLEQAQKLDEMLEGKGKKLTAVIYLEVPDEELVKRGTGRWIHQASGRTYHLIFNPPKAEGKDDVTGEPLIQREDDKEETIRNRLKIFHENNNAMLDHYDKKKVLHKVKGEGKIEDVWGEVEKILDKALA